MANQAEGWGKRRKKKTGGSLRNKIFHKKRGDCGDVGKRRWSALKKKNPAVSDPWLSMEDRESKRNE